MTTHKIFAASLAAMAHQATAVNTQLATTAAQTITESLLGLYTNCKVKVTNGAGSTAFDGTQGQVNVSFNFQGWDQNCADAKATVWLEPPEGCQASTDCDPEGYTVTIETAEIAKNAEWSTTFTTPSYVSGDWYAHVSVIPADFECAMAITDECWKIDSEKKCAGEVMITEVSNEVNLALGAADQYVGENGIIHNLNWEVSDLWNCNYCAHYRLKSITGTSEAQGSMTYQELVAFSNAKSQSTTLHSYTSYAPFEYQFRLVDCDTQEDVIPPAETQLPSPHPTCEVKGGLSISNVKAEGTTAAISNVWQNQRSYSCAESDLTASLTNGGYAYSGDLLFDTSETYVNVPDTFPDLIWTNFPIDVQGQVTVTGIWKNTTTAMPAIKDSPFDADYKFQPDCNYQVFEPTFSIDIQEGADWQSHKLSLSSSVKGVYSNYCPEMSSKIIVYQDNQQKTTASLTSAQTESFFSGGSGYDASQSVTLQDSVPFAEGQFCIEFQMTPGSDTLESKTSQRVCKTIQAEECDVTPKVTFTDSVDSEAKTITRTGSASYTYNTWCNKDLFDYYYDYNWKQEGWTEVQDPYVPALQTEQEWTNGWTSAEEDYEIETRLKITSTNKTFPSQTVTEWEATTSASHSMQCTPKFAYPPSIKNSDMGISMQIQFQTNNYGSQNCGEMYATVDVLNKTDLTTIKSFSVETSEVPKYSINADPSEAIKMYDVVIPDVDGCYIVRVTYGEVGKEALQVQESTGSTCIYHKCQLTAATVNAGAYTLADDCQSFNWNFNSSVSFNKWCRDLKLTYCLKDKNDGSEYCATESNLTLTALRYDGSAVVQQTGSFASTDFDAVLKVTGDNGASLEVQSAESSTMVHTKEFCQESYSTAASALTDTMSTVKFQQTITGDHCSPCGAAQRFYSMNEHSSDGSALLSQDWQAASASQKFSFTCHSEYSNFPGIAYPCKNTATIDWVQGCVIEIEDVKITGFTAADNNTETTAKISLYALGGDKLGDCTGGKSSLTEGQIYNIVAKYSDGVNDYPVTIDQNAFWTASGWTGSYDIQRQSKEYTFTVQLTAPEAQTPEEHQALTTEETGFVNVVSVTETTSSTSPTPLCDVVVESISLDGFREETDWQGPMIATYSGTIKSEQSCQSVAGQIKLKSEETGNYLSTTDVELTKADDYTYFFTGEVLGPNKYGNYSFKAIAYDSANPSDKDQKYSSLELWDPPCYLNIAQFRKVSQDTSIDHLKTQLNYNVQLEQHGDNACRLLQAKVSMSNAEGTTFTHWFDWTDVHTSLYSDGGFNYTVGMDTSSALAAHLDWMDPRADNVNADALGYVPETEIDCSVNVQDFCLDEATDLGDGKWSFEFTIRAQSNSKCGAVSATMDIIYEDSKYLGQVTLPDNAIIDAFNCDCVKTFVVEAEYDGSPGDLYGQLDIRNAEHNVIQMTDSCTYTVAA